MTAIRPLNSARIDLNLLPVLDTVLRERSVSRAAAHLNLSQPAVSHALARAREALGDELLVREGSAMRPTPQALRLAAPLSELLGGIERLLQSTRSFDPADLQGEVRIGMSDYADFLLLPSLLEFLQQKAPALRIVTRDISSEKMAEDLASGQMDMAVAFKLAEQPGIHERHLLSDRHVCLTQSAHRKPMTLARYLAAQHVQVSYRGVFSGGLDEALARLGHVRKVAVFTPHVLAAAAAAANAGFVLTIPEWLARQLVKNFPLRISALPFDFPALALTLSWHARNDADAAQAWLREALTTVAGRHATSSRSARPRAVT